MKDKKGRVESVLFDSPRIQAAEKLYNDAINILERSQKDSGPLGVRRPIIEMTEKDKLKSLTIFIKKGHAVDKATEALISLHGFINNEKEGLDRSVFKNKPIRLAKKTGPNYGDHKIIVSLNKEGKITHPKPKNN